MPQTSERNLKRYESRKKRQLNIVNSLKQAGTDFNNFGKGISEIGNTTISKETALSLPAAVAGEMAIGSGKRTAEYVGQGLAAPYVAKNAPEYLEKITPAITKSPISVASDVIGAGTEIAGIASLSQMVRNAFAPMSQKSVLAKTEYVSPLQKKELKKFLNTITSGEGAASVEGSKAAQALHDMSLSRNIPKEMKIKIFKSLLQGVIPTL